MGIPAAFRQLGMVVEIDSNCLVEDDYSSVRVVVEHARPDRVLGDLWVANIGGLNATFQIEVLHTWRREDQLDENGRLRPFFPCNRRGNGGGVVFTPPSGHPANGPPGSMGNPLPRFVPERYPTRDLPRPFGGLALFTFRCSVIRAFPFAPLPRLSIILPSRLLGADTSMTAPPLRSVLFLALPWYDNDPTPPAPPPSPVALPHHPPPRCGHRSAGRPPQRASSRLATKCGRTVRNDVPTRRRWSSTNTKPPKVSCIERFRQARSTEGLETIHVYLPNPIIRMSLPLRQI